MAYVDTNNLPNFDGQDSEAQSLEAQNDKYNFLLRFQDLPPDKVGFLHKKSPALLKSWQKRYIELKDRRFTWFKLKKISKKQ
jgi:hypothetical protein